MVDVVYVYIYCFCLIEDFFGLISGLLFDELLDVLRIVEKLDLQFMFNEDVL